MEGYYCEHSQQPLPNATRKSPVCHILIPMLLESYMLVVTGTSVRMGGECSWQGNKKTFLGCYRKQRNANILPKQTLQMAIEDSSSCTVVSPCFYAKTPVLGNLLLKSDLIGIVKLGLCQGTTVFRKLQT